MGTSFKPPGGTPVLLNFQIRVGTRMRFCYYATNPSAHPGFPHGQYLPLPENAKITITNSAPTILGVELDPAPNRGQATGYLVGLAVGSAEIQYHFKDKDGNNVLPDIQDFIDVVGENDPAIYLLLTPESL